VAYQWKNHIYTPCHESFYAQHHLSYHRDELFLIQLITFQYILKYREANSQQLTHEKLASYSRNRAKLQLND
jgi:hypothetical protein